MDTEIEETSAAAEHTVASTLYNYVFHGIPFLQSQEIKWTSPTTEHTDIKATSSPAEHIHSKSSSSDAESMEIIPSKPHTFLHPPMDPLLLPPMNPWLLRMDPLMDGTSATEITGSLSPPMDPLMDETSATEITGSLSPPMDPLMDETSATEITGSLSSRMDPLMHERSATEITAHAEITERHRPSNYIYRVPEHIRELAKNPLAEQLYFEPKLVSIGPYFHGVPKLKRMQDLKIWCIPRQGRLMLPDERVVINPELLRQFMVSGREARAYYKEGFDHGDDEFVEMIILDSFFIIRTIFAFSQQIRQRMSFLDGHIKEVRSDLLLLDNQIPLFFIKEVYEWFSKDRKFPPLNTVLEPLICLDMPWRINHNALSGEVTHLLDLYWLYSLSPQMHMKLTSSERYRSEMERDLSNSSEIDFSNNTPMVMMNAAELQQTAGIEFEKFKHKGHLDVIFSNGIMRMPRLKIDKRQTTLLRNLIAFEDCFVPRMRIISYYVKLMDALIDSGKDVELLHKCGVIHNTLNSHEMAATFFNDIGDFCLTDDNANPFSGLYKDVQEYYDSRWHRRLASLQHNYFSSPWTGISVVAAVILLFLAVLQAFYTIYGYQHQKN